MWINIALAAMLLARFGNLAASICRRLFLGGGRLGRALGCFVPPRLFVFGCLKQQGLL
jgi:hypothetical protein